MQATEMNGHPHNHDIKANLPQTWGRGFKSSMCKTAYLHKGSLTCVSCLSVMDEISNVIHVWKLETTRKGAGKTAQS